MVGTFNKSVPVTWPLNRGLITVIPNILGIIYSNIFFVKSIGYLASIIPRNHQPTIWVNYNNSLFWIKATKGDDFPMNTMIPVRENNEVIIIDPDSPYIFHRYSHNHRYSIDILINHRYPIDSDIPINHWYSIFHKTIPHNHQSTRGITHQFSQINNHNINHYSPSQRQRDFQGNMDTRRSLLFSLPSFTTG